MDRFALSLFLSIRLGKEKKKGITILKNKKKVYLLILKDQEKCQKYGLRGTMKTKYKALEVSTVIDSLVNK